LFVPLSLVAADEAWATIRHGWTKYLRQPVLPASLAYVLVCFNVALAPGALMTTFLIHHGTRSSTDAALSPLYILRSVIIELAVYYYTSELFMALARRRWQA